MLRIGLLFFFLFVSMTISLPICSLSYWVDSRNATCSSTPNGTYPSLNYNGMCIPSPDNPKKASYSLIINTETKTVLNFTVYDGKVCDKVNALLVAKTPLALNTCGTLYFITAASIFTDIGSLTFTCQND